MSQSFSPDRSPANDPDLPTERDLTAAIRFITNVDMTSSFDPSELASAADVLNRVFEGRDSFGSESVLGTRYAMHDIRRFLSLATELSDRAATTTDDMLANSSSSSKDIFADNYNDNLPSSEDIKAAVKFIMRDIRSLERIVPDSEEARTLTKYVGILDDVWSRRDELSDKENVLNSGWGTPDIRELLIRGRDYQSELYQKGILEL